MARTFSFADAARLLGRSAGPQLEALDRISGGLLSGATVTLPHLLGFFGATTKVVSAGRALVNTVAERRSGLARYDRTQRLHAAHSIIVATAYFDELATAGLPLAIGELGLTKAEQTMLVTGRSPQSANAAALVAELLEAPIPLPTPQRPSEATVAELRSYFAEISTRLLTFVDGLAGWERLDERARTRFRTTVDGIPDAACARYEVLLRALAIEFEEVAYWANSQDHRATRGAVRELRTALSELEQRLDAISAGLLPSARIAALATAYRAELDRPLIESGDVPGGLRMPTLGAAYLDPLFRVTDVPRDAVLTDESWWRAIAVRADLDTFLAGYLTAPQATQAPLLVLGQPGSGKSMLTKMLAARLPAGDFLVVRVALRQTQADLDVQDQIEQAIRQATGERWEWPTLVRSAGNALPIVLLDGFDEMLQATGVTQSDYLLRVRAFQRREADQGRPVAIVLTNRITLADQARIPEDTVALRLEPFDRPRVSAWLGIWRRTNQRYFRDAGLGALGVDSAMRYRELAEQPLLLLMLALYDAHDNALQQATRDFQGADLYEGLLTWFAQREVTKQGAPHPAEALDHAAEEQLHQLAVVAFAMFNRATVRVTEADLRADFAAMVGERAPSEAGQGFHAPLGITELVLGRFFFIQESQTFQGEHRLRTYEFLHSTFGEFLVARLIWQVLSGMVARESVTALTPLRAGPQDDGLLFAVLSFNPISSRQSVLGFLAEFAARAPEATRAATAGLVIALFQRSTYGREDRSLRDYEPRRLPAPTRHCAYSANLLLLAVLLRRRVLAGELWPDQDLVVAWYRHTLLWRSQMIGRDYTSVLKALAVHQVRSNGRRDLELRFDDGSFSVLEAGLDWIYRDDILHASNAPAVLAPEQHPDVMQRRMLFSMARNDMIVEHVLEPMFATVPDSVNLLVNEPGEPLVAAAHLLMRVLFEPEDDLGPAYRRAAALVMDQRVPWSASTRVRFARLLVRRLGEDATPTLVDEIVRTLRFATDLRAELTRCVVSVLGREPGTDGSLVSVLSSLVDGALARESPAVALDAWIRLVELDLIEQACDLLAEPAELFAALDRARVRTERPELIARARWALAARGTDVEWAG